MTRGSKHSLAERIGGLALKLPQVSRMQAELRARIEEQTFKERIMAREFDASYYLSVNPDIKASDVDPFRHFVETGWREGRNPNPRFNTKYYVSQNADVAEAGINPFLHYLEQGRVEGRLASKEEEQFLKEEEVIRPRLDREYYLNTNPEVRSSGIDPVRHYVRYGWQQGLNPTPDFSTMMYLLFNEDLLRSKINPFYHYILQGQGESRLGANLANLRNDYLWSRMPHRMQDITFPNHVEKAEALFVIMVPEHNTMSGGIYSFFSIAKAAYNMRHKHDYAVVLMTRPNRYELTYLRQSNFRNYEDVFRFEQLARCKWVKRLYLNIPEYAAPGFLASLSKEQREYLISREHLYINILNQNYELMPEKEELEDLRGFTHELTQSVAHHAYFSQAHADQYDLPTLLLPAYTDLSGYEAIDRNEKEKLIIYSPDEEPHRDPVLKALKKGLPDYKLLEIRDITFDKYMDLATRCLFSVSFGEGFDGYVAQPIYQGGIGMAVYREEYFPSEDLRDFPNFFSSDEDMIENIVSRIREFEQDEALYRRTNKSMMEIYNALYSKEDYMRRVGKLIRREFEIYPRARTRRDEVFRL